MNTYEVFPFEMYDDHTTTEWHYQNWWCVENDDGVIAQFSTCEMAERFVDAMKTSNA